MQNIKYYVLWIKNSPLLKEYLEKYSHLLLERIDYIKNKTTILNELNLLISSKNSKEFILNADISSIINYLHIEKSNDNDDTLEKEAIFKKEIEIFLSEWIDSINLTMNKWQIISSTNIRLTTNDDNPYNKLEAHPDHLKGWAISWNWWKKTEEEWLDVYNKTFILLKKLDEWIYDELNQIITKIIPLWTASQIHNSASYKECVGHLYMWFTLDSDNPEINNLEAIIHESSHNKLNLIMQFDPVVLNEREEKYYSAIRPDARPIIWVFLWYHAFAPTMYIVMKAYNDWHLWDDIRWLEKIVLYYIKTKFLQKVIKKYAKLTELWLEISAEIDYVITKMDKLFAEINPSKELIIRAKQKQTEHFREVNHKYPHLEY